MTSRFQLHAVRFSDGFFMNPLRTSYQQHMARKVNRVPRDQVAHQGRTKAATMSKGDEGMRTTTTSSKGKSTHEKEIPSTRYVDAARVGTCAGWRYFFIDAQSISESAACQR